MNQHSKEFLALRVFTVALATLISVVVGSTISIEFGLSYGLVQLAISMFITQPFRSCRTPVSVENCDAPSNETQQPQPQA